MPRRSPLLLAACLALFATAPFAQDYPRKAVTLVVAAFAQGYQMQRSRGDARRLIEQGSVQLQGEKITDPKAAPALKCGDVLRLDKTRAVRVA